MKTYEIPCGASRRRFVQPLTDIAGALLPGSGANVTLQGFGVDDPSLYINKPGTLDATTGRAIFDEMGLLVTTAQVGARAHADIKARVRYADADGEDFSPWFILRFLPQPAQIAALEEVFVFNDLHKLVRSYVFDAAPRAVRNTFLGSTQSQERPAWYFTASNAGNSNKVYEVALESGIADVVFEGPDSSDHYDYPTLVDGSFWSGANTPANLDDNAWAGIELWSHEDSVPPFDAAPAHPVVQLRQSLKTKTLWELVVAKGDGVTPATRVAFSLPDLNPGGMGEGHKVGLYYSRKDNEAKAWVDGVVRAVISDPATMPDSGLITATTWVGLFVCTGAMTASTTVFCSWTGFRVTSFGTGLPQSAL